MCEVYFLFVKCVNCSNIDTRATIGKLLRVRVSVYGPFRA